PHLKTIGRAHVALDIADWPQFTQSAIEGAVLADYRFEKFKDKKTAEIKSLRCIAREVAAAKRDAARGEIIAAATNYARSIGNEPGNVIFPASLANEAKKLAAREKLRVKIFD